jgi:arylsulfatase A-like enzyme
MLRAVAAVLCAVECLGGYGRSTLGSSPRKPNLVVIIADDQGYGDLGIHGNTKIRTPHLDRLARQGVRLSQFYVSPVCSPTRASLLTGRYNYRTGVVDTFLGRSIMDPAELTLAERLASAGYRTGIFGKWHLGDNLPARPIDQGFRQALVHKGGGIGQPSDLPGGSHYMDPVLLHDGKPRRYQGYCTDVFTTAAIEFMNVASDRPFLLYLAFNCPHDPLEAPEPELGTYRAMKLGADQFPSTGFPLPRPLDEDRIARVYAMVSRIDTNVGRLLAALDARGLADSTIVVFLTDNGPAFARYNSGMRGLKGTTYEGGIRVPCFVRWPGRFPAGLVVDRVAAHIDLAPTLLAACEVAVEREPEIDGRSLLPLLRGEPAASWPDRTIYFQWHRGDEPEFGRSFAARSQRFKLLRRDDQPARPRPPLELYDIEHDPYEQHDLAAVHPEIVSRMYAAYLDWFRDVCGTRGFEPVRIQIGDPREIPTVLTRQDWRSPGTGLSALGGAWQLDVARNGRYEVRVHVEPSRVPRTAHLRFQTVVIERPLSAGTDALTFPPVSLTRGPAALHVWLEGPGPDQLAGVLDASVARLGAD